MALAAPTTRSAPPSAGFRANGCPASELRRIAAGGELAYEGNLSAKLFVVRSGWMLRQDILDDGRRQILEFLLPEDLLAEAPSRRAASSVEAITESEIAIMPLASFGAEPESALIEAMRRSLENAYDSLTDAGRRSSLEAVAHFLFRMERRARNVLGVRADGAVEFPLTQEHIGDAVGMTSVHVCRMMRSLIRDGVIETGRNHLRILDRPRLADIACLSPESKDQAALRTKRPGAV